MPRRSGRNGAGDEGRGQTSSPRLGLRSELLIFSRRGQGRWRCSNRAHTCMEKLQRPAIGGRLCGLGGKRASHHQSSMNGKSGLAGGEGSRSEHGRRSRGDGWLICAFYIIILLVHIVIFECYLHCYIIVFAYFRRFMGISYRVPICGI
jgi:hypothetical protein